MVRRSGSEMQAALDAILRRFISVGRLTVRWPDGRLESYAGPAGSGPEAAITLRSRDGRRLVLNPALAVGEGYMDGGLTPTSAGSTTCWTCWSSTWRRMPRPPARPALAVLGLLKRRIDQYNPAHRARRNVAHHYDLNGRLYSLFSIVIGSIRVPIFRAGMKRWRRRRSPRSGTSPPSSASIGRICGAGYRLRLGRARADPGTRLRRARHRHHAVHRTAGRGTQPRRAEGLGDRVSFELLDYRAWTARSTASSRWACSNMSASAITAFFDAVARA